MGFEWNEDKRRETLAEREIDFSGVTALFDGRPVLTYPSPRGGEERWVTVGVIEGKVFAAVWTMRGGNIRIISRRGGRGMAKKGRIVRYTAEEIAAMRARGEDRTNYAREDSAEEVERQIATDPDLAVPEDWAERIIRGLPFPLPRETKRPVHIRLDPEVLAYFKAEGRGWQTRINAVLRSFVERQQRR